MLSTYLDCVLSQLSKGNIPRLHLYYVINQFFKVQWLYVFHMVLTVNRNYFPKQH
jgi:hypothetical protein